MKRIESPVKKWPGHVLLYDPLPLAKVAAFEDVIRSVDRSQFGSATVQNAILPALIPCVAEWHLDGFPDPVTPEDFPGTPRKESSILISALITAVTELYKGDENSDPNE